MKWLGLLFLIGVAVFGVHVGSSGLCPEHGKGAIAGQLRIWRQEGKCWVGQLAVDAGHMKRRTGSWKKQFDIVVTDPEVAAQIEQVGQQAGTMQVDYWEYLVKPLSHPGPFTVVAVKAVM